MAFVVYSSAQHNDTARIAAKNTPDARRTSEIFLVPSYNHPVRHSGAYWAPFLGGGITVFCPTPQSGLLTRWYAGAGYLKKSDTRHRREMVHISMAFAYPITLPWKVLASPISLRPSAGLSYMTVNMSETKVKFSELHDLFFGTFESEFGTIATIEPTITLGSVIVSLPVSGEMIFSSPRLYTMVSLSLCAGVVF